WVRRGSNSRLRDYETHALPTAPPTHTSLWSADTTKRHRWHGENMWAVELASSNRHSAYWATLGIEPRTPSTLRKDHTTRPSSQCRSRQGNRRAGINRTEAKLKRALRGACHPHRLTYIYSTTLWAHMMAGYTVLCGCISDADVSSISQQRDEVMKDCRRLRRWVWYYDAKKITCGRCVHMRLRAARGG